MLIGYGKSKTVHMIRMSGREVNEMTKWVVGGSTNSNGDSEHYAMQLFPALLKIEVGDRKQRLKYDLTTVSDAMRFCFNNQRLEVCIVQCRCLGTGPKESGAQCNQRDPR
jgi:hypothetical protein